MVTEQQLARLMGQGHDPLTDTPLGRAYPQYRSLDERIRARAEKELTKGLTGQQREAALERITQEERQRGQRHAVAGYDFTFSVPKSISTVWALADASVQEAIVAAHHEAVAEVIDWMEREVAVTRAGYPGPDGSAVAQAAVTGLIVTAFDHFESRAGDPQLHTHAVVSNKVLTVMDGRWRSLDGRSIHAATVGLSEYYNTLLYDKLTRALGVAWDQRRRGRDRNLIWEITGIPEHLITDFSQRSQAIETETDRLIQHYVRTHGRQPPTAVKLRLRAEATLATRPDKQHRSLAELTAEWRQRAAQILQVEDPTTWLNAALAAGGVDAGLVDGVPWRAGDFLEENLVELAATVVGVVSDARSTWGRWNLWAETSRQLAGWRFATTEDREITTGAVVDRAITRAVCLTPPELAPSPAAFRRTDGTSVFRPYAGQVYTTADLLEAEARLLELVTTTTGPTAQVSVHASQPAGTRSRGRGTDPHGSRSARRHDRHHRSHGLSPEQQEAVTMIAESGRVLDVLVGAAGAGKTTTMRHLRAVWEHQHGAGSVIGLAPSAGAAEVLAHDLDVGCENTAKWLFEHRRGNRNLQPGQLVILDEASLAGTRTLDEITAHAAAVGAKVLLLGDPKQLSAVDAGGAFGMLVRHLRSPRPPASTQPPVSGSRPGEPDTSVGRIPGPLDDLHALLTAPDSEPDPPAAATGDPAGVAELVEIHRFKAGWEREASLRLRRGDPRVLDVYNRHGRLEGGTTEATMDGAYRAWRRDNRASLQSLLLAENHETVVALNLRARLDRIAAGHVQASRQVQLHDGTHASKGDVVITRHNDRRLHTTSRGWVKNGDRWTVHEVRDTGEVTLRRLTKRRWGASATVRIPAEYAATQLELGYAVTIHRAQGLTVDTCHLLVHSAQMVREAFYVAMTRGRTANVAWVATDQAHLEAHQHRPDRDPETPLDPVTVLTGVLNHVGAEISAHETMRAEQDHYTDLRQLVAEYNTLATTAQHAQLVAMLHRLRLDPDQIERITTAEAYGALATQLREAAADGHHPLYLLDHALARRRLDDAEDPAAVLHDRIAKDLTSIASAARRQRRTAGSRASSNPTAQRQQPPGHAAPILGLIAAVTSHGLDPDMQAALQQRVSLIEHQTQAMLATALQHREAWTQELGSPPTNRRRQQEWLAAALTVTAYRALHRNDDQPNNQQDNATTQQHKHRRDQALTQAQKVARRQPQRPNSRANQRRGIELSN